MPGLLRTVLLSLCLYLLQLDDVTAAQDVPATRRDCDVIPASQSYLYAYMREVVKQDKMKNQAVPIQDAEYPLIISNPPSYIMINLVEQKWKIKLNERTRLLWGRIKFDGCDTTNLTLVAELEYGSESSGTEIEYMERLNTDVFDRDNEGWHSFPMIPELTETVEIEMFRGFGIPVTCGEIMPAIELFTANEWLNNVRGEATCSYIGQESGTKMPCDWTLDGQYIVPSQAEHPLNGSPTIITLPELPTLVYVRIYFNTDDSFNTSIAYNTPGVQKNYLNTAITQKPGVSVTHHLQRQPVDHIEIIINSKGKTHITEIEIYADISGTQNAVMPLRGTTCTSSSNSAHCANALDGRSWTTAGQTNDFWFEITLSTVYVLHLLRIQQDTLSSVSTEVIEEFTLTFDDASCQKFQVMLNKPAFGKSSRWHTLRMESVLSQKINISATTSLELTNGFVKIELYGFPNGTDDTTFTPLGEWTSEDTSPTIYTPLVDTGENTASGDSTSPGPRQTDSNTLEPATEDTTEDFSGWTQDALRDSTTIPGATNPDVDATPNQGTDPSQTEPTDSGEDSRETDATDGISPTAAAGITDDFSGSGSHEVSTISSLNDMTSSQDVTDPTKPTDDQPQTVTDAGSRTDDPNSGDGTRPDDDDDMSTTVTGVTLPDLTSSGDDKQGTTESSQKPTSTQDLSQQDDTTTPPISLETTSQPIMTTSTQHYPSTLVSSSYPITRFFDASDESKESNEKESDKSEKESDESKDSGESTESNEANESGEKITMTEATTFLETSTAGYPTTTETLETNTSQTPSLSESEPPTTPTDEEQTATTESVTTEKTTESDAAATTNTPVESTSEEPDETTAPTTSLVPTTIDSEAILEYNITMRIIERVFPSPLDDKTSGIYTYYRNILAPLIKKSLEVCIPNRFMGVIKDIVFWKGSIMTSYTFDVNGSNPLTVSQHDAIKYQLMKDLNQSGFKVDPKSFVIKYNEARPPPVDDSKNILLAGVLGAVVTIVILGVVIITILCFKYCRDKRERQQETRTAERRAEASQWGGSSHSLQSFQLPRATLPGNPMRFQNTVSMTYGSLTGHHVGGSVFDPHSNNSSRRSSSMDYLQGPAAKLPAVHEMYYNKTTSSAPGAFLQVTDNSDEDINNIIGLDTFAVGSPSRQSLDVELGEEPNDDFPWGQGRQRDDMYHRTPSRNPGFEWENSGHNTFPRTPLNRQMSQDSYYSSGGGSNYGNEIPTVEPNLHRTADAFSYLSNSAHRNRDPPPYSSGEYHRQQPPPNRRYIPRAQQRSPRSIDSLDTSSQSTPPHEVEVENLYDSLPRRGERRSQQEDDALSLYYDEGILGKMNRSLETLRGPKRDPLHRNAPGYFGSKKRIKGPVNRESNI